VVKGFCNAVTIAFSGFDAKWLVLGDSTHGEKSLKSLAAAVNANQLDLRKLGVTTVLIEGPKKGQEEIFEEGVYKSAIQILKGKRIIVRGCENKVTLSAEKGIKKLYANPSTDPTAFSGALHSLLDKRITDANDSWIKQVQDYKPRVIICVGTSHLAKMNTPNAKDLGLVVRLGFKGSCVGYAVEAPNSGDDKYIPEKASGSFDALEAITAFNGWRKL
jgi:hypothetical protein